MATNIADKTYSATPLFQALRDRIVSGEYPPGTLLSEKELTQEFNVSRTPYREALKQLEALKLIKVVPRFGTYVSEVDINEVLHAYEVRVGLEAMAASLAAERRSEEELIQFEQLLADCKRLLREDPLKHGSKADIQLHELILTTARNPILIEMIDRLRPICSRIWTSTWRENYDFENLIKLWEEIYRSVKEQDREAAGLAMARHVKDSVDSLKNNIFRR